MNWSVINDSLNYIVNNFPIDAFLVVIGGGLALSVSALILKLSKKLSKGSRQTIIYLAGVAGALGNYLLTTPTSVPWVIYVQGAVLFVASQAWWRLAVKRVAYWVYYKFIEAIKTNDEVKSALQPVAKIEADVTPVPPVIVPETVADSAVHTFDR